MAKNISRKEFLKATAMSAAGIGLLGAGVLNAKADIRDRTAEPRKSRLTKIPASGFWTART